VSAVPAIRIHKCNDAPERPSGQFVLYWMIASRRLRYNFALDRAVEHCRALRKPLVVFEAVRADYLWASDRIHRFIVEGMADNQTVCERRGIRYLAYVEPAPGAGKGLLAALARDACIVVTDDFPGFFLPRMVMNAAKRVGVSLETVDSNGLLPLRAARQVYLRAFDFRRFLQRELPNHLAGFPVAEPLRRMATGPAAQIARETLKRWPMASPEMLRGEADSLSALPIDHSVPPSTIYGGPAAASKRMTAFLGNELPRYSEQRSEPEADAGSGFSPYLHFGHLSVHEIFAGLAAKENWRPEKLSLRGNGSKEGWWNMSPAAESFLDELVTWREAGYNFAFRRQDYDRYESLPEWARKTLAQHAKDERAYLYTVEEFESAKTHDALWNAAQTQLVREGRIHNYLRMLWGKKILEWARTPAEAARIMIHLNNKYALDGRDPNSYSGIFWVLGRYDRPWAPERAVFGRVRYMSSENTARKFRVKKYIEKYAPGEPGQGELGF